MQQDITALLGDVAFKIGTMNEARKRFAKQLAPDFNLFDYLRADELGLSVCLASLLDPKGKHGQGPVFLDAFLETVAEKATWAKNSESCRVKTEVEANGRLDICLEFPEGMIGIENKPWSGDQPGQLSRYASYLDKKCPNKSWHLLFICDREPSIQSMTPAFEKGNFKGNFDWCEYTSIVDWLDACAGKSKALTVRVFIEELAKFIRSKVSGELDMSDAKETCEAILKSKASFGAAMQISKTVSLAKTVLLQKFKLDLTAQLQSYGFQLVWDKDLETSWRSSFGFGVKFAPEHNMYLRFEFANPDLRGLFWGIKKDDSIKKTDIALWDEIRKLMQNKFGPGETSDYFPWWDTLQIAPGFESDIANWSVSERPWIMIMDESENRLVKDISNLAISVRDHLGRELSSFSPRD